MIAAAVGTPSFVPGNCYPSIAPRALASFGIALALTGEETVVVAAPYLSGVVNEQ